MPAYSIGLFIEFKEVHLREARRQGYRAHVDEAEYQERDRDSEDGDLVVHVLEGVDDTQQEERERVDDGHKVVGVALCVVSHAFFQKLLRLTDVRLGCLKILFCQAGHIERTVRVVLLHPLDRFGKKAAEIRLLMRLDLVADEFDLGNYRVEIKDGFEKYYFRGFHISGKMDNTNDVFVPVTSLTVDKDYDLVATYNIKANQVKYIIRFLSEEGVEIYPSEERYGNAGDIAPVTHRYVPGFTPVTTELTPEDLTLPLDGHVKEFRFRYRANPGTEIEIIDEGTTIYVYEPRTIYTGGGGGGTGGVEVIEATTIEDNPTPQANPDNNPPLANWSNQLLETSPILAYLIIGLAAIFGISLIAFLIFLFRRKRRDNE